MKIGKEQQTRKFLGVLVGSTSQFKACIRTTATFLKRLLKKAQRLKRSFVLYYLVIMNN